MMISSFLLIASMKTHLRFFTIFEIDKQCLGSVMTADEAFVINLNESTRLQSMHRSYLFAINIFYDFKLNTSMLTIKTP